MIIPKIITRLSIAALSFIICLVSCPAFSIIAPPKWAKEVKNLYVFSVICNLYVLNRIKTDFCREKLEIKCREKTYIIFSI